MRRAFAEKVLVVELLLGEMPGLGHDEFQGAPLSLELLGDVAVGVADGLVLGGELDHLAREGVAVDQALRIALRGFVLVVLGDELAAAVPRNPRALLAHLDLELQVGHFLLAGTYPPVVLLHLVQEVALLADVCEDLKRRQCRQYVLGEERDYLLVRLLVIILRSRVLPEEGEVL